MGDKILGIVLLATAGAILGDMLVHADGTRAVFQGIGGLAQSTYSAAAGAYSRA